MKSETSRSCPICSGTMAHALDAWLRRCPACGLWASEVGSGVGRLREDTSLVEDRVRSFLRPLRMQNFGLLLDELAHSTELRGATVLDVGCGYGWFLQVAAQRGMRPVGIEPDELFAEQARTRGFDVRKEFFPDAVGDGERFDVIVFNDVFEHMANPGAVLDSCHAALAPHGRLVLNLPDSRGFFYRASCLLARLGAHGPLRRMWQVDYRSPHLFYFDASNLERFASQHRFAMIHGASLPSVRLRGLWSRLRVDADTSIWSAALTWAGIAASYPVLSTLAPPDILLQVYEARGRSSGRRSGSAP